MHFCLRPFLNAVGRVSRLIKKPLHSNNKDHEAKGAVAITLKEKFSSMIDTVVFQDALTTANPHYGYSGATPPDAPPPVQINSYWEPESSYSTSSFEEEGLTFGLGWPTCHQQPETIYLLVCAGKEMPDGTIPAFQSLDQVIATLDSQDTLVEEEPYSALGFAEPAVQDSDGIRSF